MPAMDQHNFTAQSAVLADDGAASYVDSIVGSHPISLVLLSGLLYCLALAFIYHDRLIFTRPNRPNALTPDGALPLIGHTYWLVKECTSRPYEKIYAWVRRSPNSVVRVTVLGQGSLIMFNRPEYIEYIQKTNFQNYLKGTQFRSRVGDVLGLSGIFVADGNAWKSQRKLASHMFSARQFNTCVQSVVQGELQVIVNLLDNISKTPAQTVALPDLFFRYTLSSFSKIAFSADINCLSMEPGCMARPIPFASAFDHCQGVLNDRFVLPAWQLIEWATGQSPKMRNSIQLIHDFGYRIIQQRLAEEKQEKLPTGAKWDENDAQGGGKDLLSLFMEHTRDPKDLIDVVLNFLIAGRDTTAQALSWLFYELCAHPEHVSVVRAEVESLFGADCKPEDRWLRPEDVKRLPYTLAVAHESLRLHPPVAKNCKEVVADDLVIPQGPNPYNLPPVQVFKGEKVAWCDWAMNRLEEVWGPDAAEFNPTRFLTRGEDGEWVFVRHSPWKFHVFNAGPRQCLGLNLANYEILAFMAATLPKFDFTWSTKEEGQTSEWPPSYGSSVTHPVKDSYLCTVTRR